MDNIQTEVLEIEFLTYSKGMTTISEEDFAKILLRFTNVENISAYLENVRQCIPDEKVESLVGFPRLFSVLVAGEHKSHGNQKSWEENPQIWPMTLSSGGSGCGR